MESAGANGFGNKLLRRWGMAFRAFTILAVGTAVWALLDPPSISNIPISQLTVNQVVRCIAAPLSAIGCFNWFLSFPERRYPDGPDPYVTWGKYGLWTIAVAVLTWAWADANL